MFLYFSTSRFVAIILHALRGNNLIQESFVTFFVSFLTDVLIGSCFLPQQYSPARINVFARVLVTLTVHYSILLHWYIVTWDRDELRPVWVYISLHTFLSIPLHGTGLKMNSDRSDCMLVAKLTRVTFVRQDFSAGGGWRVAGDGWRVTGSGWQVTGSEWQVTGSRWRVMGGRWRVRGSGWRVTGGGWRVAGGGWRVAG